MPKTAGLWRYYLSFQETSLLTALCSNSRSGAIGRALGQGKIYKKVRVCHIQELETPFVGNLYREENVIIEKVQEKC